MFIGNFYGTYERSSTIETLKSIKRKHDESLQDYVKCFCNTRKAVPYIQDIKIINAFCDGVSDIKTVEDIASKKPKQWSICSQSLTYALRLLRPRLDSWSLTARGPRRRSRMIKKSTRLTVETAWIAETTGIAAIVSSSPQIRRRRGLSSILPM
jgi:hypothetical protein